MQFFAATGFEAIVEWVLSHFVTIFIAVVFFVLPILRGIKEQAAKKRQMEAGGPEPRGAADEAAQGRQAWEALLRGEEPAPAPPPVLMTPTPTPPPIPRPVEGAEAKTTLAGRLSDFDSKSRADEDQAESTFDEESLATEMNERLLREEMQRRADFLAREKESAARKTVAPEGLVTIEATDEAVTAAQDRSARRILFAPGSDRRANLRRALLAREVLGPPLSLRTDRDALGPTAISR